MHNTHLIYIMLLFYEVDLCSVFKWTISENTDNNVKLEKMKQNISWQKSNNGMADRI